jgi:hypothetical protein
LKRFTKIPGFKDLMRVPLESASRIVLLTATDGAEPEDDERGRLLHLARPVSLRRLLLF